MTKNMTCQNCKNSTSGYCDEHLFLTPMTTLKRAEDWTEQYPLNTFKGETKKELIDFIRNLLQSQEEEMIEKLKDYKNTFIADYPDEERIVRRTLDDVLAKLK